MTKFWPIEAPCGQQERCVGLPGSFLIREEAFLPFLLPDATMEVIVGASAISLDTEVTLRLEACRR